MSVVGPDFESLKRYNIAELIDARNETKGEPNAPTNGTAEASSVRPEIESLGGDGGTATIEIESKDES